MPKFSEVRENFIFGGVRYPLALLKQNMGGWALWALREEGILGRLLWVAIKLDGSGVVGPVRVVDAHLVQLDPPRPGSPVELVMSLAKEPIDTVHSDYLILETDHKPEPKTQVLGRMGLWRQADG